ncbi:MAG TPA: LysR family transcriptional regulator [Terriglobales bacterium]|nr:LysR family transcriptional regulator [Terriglobales bacterium]
MDLFQLETFLAVAHEGGFSRAAKKLYRTQPAISQTVRKLEMELGEALFDRSSHEGVLTDAGRVLESYATKLLNMRSEAEIALHDLRKLQFGQLKIAANEFTCMYLLPLVDEYRRLYPKIKVTVQRSLASRIADELIHHNAEMGVLTFRPDDQMLKSVAVYRDDVVFVLPPEHPLAGQRDVTLKQLSSECFVAHNVPSPYRAKVIDTFKKKRVPLHMDVELPSIEAIKKCVARKNGVALLPGICVQAEVQRGELAAVPVRELHFERKLRLVYRRGANLSHAARNFLKVAQGFAERVGDPYLYKVE